MDILAQNDPKGFASLLTARLNRLTMTKKRDDQLDKDSGLESFQDALGSVSRQLSNASIKSHETIDLDILI